MEKRVTEEDLKELFDELHKSEYWIPTFPVEYRNHPGMIISPFLFFWVLIMLIIGGLNKVVNFMTLLLALGSVITAFLIAKIGRGIMLDNLEEKYLIKREKEFARICDEWAAKKKEKGVTIEVSRFAAYLVLEFKNVLPSLGKYLMRQKKAHMMEKERKLQEQRDNEALGSDRDQY